MSRLRALRRYGMMLAETAAGQTRGRIGGNRMKRALSLLLACVLVLALLSACGGKDAAEQTPRRRHRRRRRPPPAVWTRPARSISRTTRSATCAPTPCTSRMRRRPSRSHMRRRLWISSSRTMRCRKTARCSPSRRRAARSAWTWTRRSSQACVERLDG